MEGPDDQYMGLIKDIQGLIAVKQSAAMGPFSMSENFFQLFLKSGYNFGLFVGYHLRGLFPENRKDPQWNLENRIDIYQIRSQS